jgi:formylglycine-generating enzyme required for sulfatase activity
MKSTFGAIALALAIVGCARAPLPPTFRDHVSGIEFVLIPAGEFTMGSTPDTFGRELQETPHHVTLSRSFYLGRTETTQAQWQAVMGTNPSYFAACGPSCPVERVTYADVEAFIGRLNQAAGPRYRLPTEAEWEFACRAGGDSTFGSRDTLGSGDANIDGRFPYKAALTQESAGTVPVGRFPANAWGLVDMSGNVWEWVQDRHCPYPEGSATDPVGSCSSPHRVIRGGSWKFDGNSARCALRYTHRPQDLGFSLGFRVARDDR